jgi:phosphomannomutase
MIPWLLIAARLSHAQQPLSALVQERINAYPCSGEMNFQVADAAGKMQTILASYAGQRPVLDETDGISVEFPQWRFNLRSSNTEPLLRLNVESRGDKDLLIRQTEALRQLITC